MAQNHLPQKKNEAKDKNFPILTLTTILTILVGLFVFFLQQSYLQFQNQEQQRIEYSKSLIGTTEKYFFLGQNFYLNYKNEPDFQSRKIDLWNQYYQAVEEYNFNLVPNLVTVKIYYGDDIQIYYNEEVYKNLLIMHTQLDKIRTGDNYDENLLMNTINILDNRKFVFAKTLINCNSYSYSFYKDLEELWAFASGQRSCKILNASS